MTATPPSTLDPARAIGPDPSAASCVPGAAACGPGQGAGTEPAPIGPAVHRPLLGRFGADDEGASAIEYALMAMFFSVTVIGGSSSIRNALQTAFTTVSSAILGASNG